MYRGWKQIEYQSKHYNINQKTKEHRTTEEEMEGPNSSLGLINRKHAQPFRNMMMMKMRILSLNDVS